jgi:hypothetical protein
LKRALTPGLIANLTLYRFDLARSFNLPVWQLERARGGAGRARARVLHRKVYRYDRQAALAPVDLALGWGPMSDQSVLDRLSISQSMRFYWYQYQLPPPIAPDQIVSHSTNVHLIPATEQIASLCKSLRTGSLVHLGGELVEATGPGIGTWRSSLSRTDTGNGACELMWVKEVTVLEPTEPLQSETIAKR